MSNTAPIDFVALQCKNEAIISMPARSRESKKLRIQADRVSGLPGCIFALSIILPLVARLEKRTRFRFPFYGLAFDAATEQASEWIDDEKYGKQADELLAFARREGRSYFEDIRKTVLKEGAEFSEEARNVLPRLSSLSDDELARSFREIMEQYIQFFSLGAVTFVYEEIVSKRLFASLSSRRSDAAKIVSALLDTGYRSFMIEGEEALVRIKRAKAGPERKKLVSRFKAEYYFLKSSYADAPVLDEQKIEQLAAEVHDVENKKAQHDTPKDLVLASLEQDIIGLLEISEVIRDERKKLNLTGCYLMFRYLDEAARRTGAPRELLKRMFWHEYPEVFADPKALQARLEKRLHAAIYYDGKTERYLEYDPFVPREKVGKEGEVKGTPASKGRATGPAKIIVSRDDFKKFRKGDVLFAEGTRPDFVPIMKIAAAIVTDEGGLTSHAAIVSRELGVPCVVGTRGATRIFKDGDRVEVDAENGVVKKL